MSEKLLSIVIPTYNMEAYLRRCLDSVTRDDVPSNLELIVVNDGSTDCSFAIMQEYAEKRPDIVNIIDKPNGHYGSCVNAALDAATGKYFRILDADDWFDTDGLIMLLTELSTLNVDLVVTPFIKHTSNGQKKISFSELDTTRTYLVTDKEIDKYTGLDTFCMHSMTYKLDLLKECNLKMQEGICYTDIEFVIYPFSKVNSILFFDSILYNYDLTRENQSMDSSVLQKNRDHLYLILKRILGNFETINFNHTKKILFNVLVTYYYLILFLSPKNDLDDSKLSDIDKMLSRKAPELQYKLYIRLLGSPIIWRFFKNRFLFYEKIKKLLGSSTAN